MSREMKKRLYVLVSAFYYHTLMLKGLRLFTYAYVYLVPLVYFLFHLDWIREKARRLASRQLIWLSAGFLIVVAYSIVIPFVLGTRDFSYLRSGPIWWVVQDLYAGIFLLCVYENEIAVTPSLNEFLDLFIRANALYVFGTIVIIALSPLRSFLVEHLYMTEIQYEHAIDPQYVSRIGWSGFSNFAPTALSTICLICCIILLLQFKEDRKSVFKYTFYMFVFLIGNLCYGRTGLIASFACCLIYFFLILMVRPRNSLIYPAAAILLVCALAVAYRFSETVQNWFTWAFAQVLNYRRTGSFETSTIKSLKSMYIRPSPKQFLFGDGWYTKGGSYYMHTDVGWLRPIFFFGIIPSLVCFSLAIVSGTQMRYALRDHQRVERVALVLMFVISYLVFESKGEIYYYYLKTLLPLLLLFDFEREGVLKEEEIPFGVIEVK